MTHEKNTEIPGAVCPLCGARFVCGAASGSSKCWCMERPLLPLEPGDGGHCLCPACFQRRLSERAAPEA
ncbi:MAG: cysteine-rich CWC family protein [Candidatus Accumulibacter sp.]|jgi:hypothetical protein|nr:cysteine-rich CWC family protein [Accumulibacter sp.]